jgi:hypothetical protein
MDWPDGGGDGQGRLGTPRCARDGLDGRLRRSDCQGSRWRQSGMRGTASGCRGTESIDLAELLQGRLVVVNQGASIAPRRKKRTARAADHAPIRSALRSAVAEGESVTVVAERLCVDIRTLAQHADLYDVARQATRDRKPAANAVRQNEVTAEAQAIAKKLLAVGLPRKHKGCWSNPAAFWLFGGLSRHKCAAGARQVGATGKNRTCD